MISNAHGMYAKPASPRLTTPFEVTSPKGWEHSVVHLYSYNPDMGNSYAVHHSDDPRSTSLTLVAIVRLSEPVAMTGFFQYQVV